MSGLWNSPNCWQFVLWQTAPADGATHVMQIMKLSATHTDTCSHCGCCTWPRPHTGLPQLIRQNKLWAKFPFRVAVSFFQLVKISFIVYDKQTMRQRDSHVLQPGRGRVCYRGRGGKKSPHWTLSHAPINLQRKTSWAKVASLSLSRTLAARRKLLIFQTRFGQMKKTAQ